MAERRFVVEGPQAVREALDSLLELYALDLTDPLAQLAAARGVEVVQVDAKVLEALAETVTPQGLVGVAPLLSAVLPDRPQLVAVLHEVNDPGNAGTVIRTADAAGADGVVLTAGSVDPHNGKCVRASAGSLWHLPVVTDADALDTIAALQAQGVRVLAATGAGEADLDELDGLAAATAWVLGTEAHGLPAEVLAAADVRVRIPIHGRAESLNLATAAAVCLYSSARAQRRASSRESAAES
ncbi:MAG: methyltransferase [Frankiales bacterium]|nr:methyltransferase [Frankiales bacterium]MCW2709619.1 methyltransferase [Frankiales bacterium]